MAQEDMTDLILRGFDSSSTEPSLYVAFAGAAAKRANEREGASDSILRFFVGDGFAETLVTVTVGF